MNPNRSRKRKTDSTWPKSVQPGRAVVKVYRRKTPAGNYSYMVANYADSNQRRLDSYPTPDEAIEVAETLAKRIDSRNYVAASMTKAEAIEFANAKNRLSPYSVSVDAATAAVAEWLKELGTLANVHAAVNSFKQNHKKVEKISVGELLKKFLTSKKTLEASERYLEDLTGRLNRFAKDFKRDVCDITSTDLQSWMDGKKFKPQNQKNFRTVLQTFFSFAVARGYAAENPAKSVQKVVVRHGDIVIFTTEEMSRLLEAARIHYPEFLPCLAIGAFAGVRSSEIQRLHWNDIHFADKKIIVKTTSAKTASRRIIPMKENLLAWLSPYQNKHGIIWQFDDDAFTKAEYNVSAATDIPANTENGTPARRAVEWKKNAMRHSYGTYRYAEIQDAGRVTAELGNSDKLAFKHYLELATPAEAEKWFSISPPPEYLQKKETDTEKKATIPVAEKSQSAVNIAAVPQQEPSP